MKKYIIVLLTFLSVSSYSQIIFEKGYYINDSNKKIDCQVKNIDWKYNPTEFIYRLSDNSEQKKASIMSVKEFGVYGVSKYVRSTVKIDRSSNNTSTMSHERAPSFKKEQLFLKVLIDGKANLYSYLEGNIIRYFYKIDSPAIKQLIFKKYLTEDNGEVGQNNRYKQQILNFLKCSSIKQNDIKKLEYKKKELIKIFVKYNQCNNQNEVNFEEKTKKDLFNLYARIGVNNSSLLIQTNILTTNQLNFENKLSLRIGAEVEFVLPFNKNKWGIIIEPTYQYFKSKKVNDVSNLSGGKLISNVNYASIEIPVGVRHYFFLKNKSKLFINASFIFDMPLNSKIEFNRADGTELYYSPLKINTTNNLAFGLGYNYDKYSLELRIQTPPREVLSNYIYWNSEYKNVSIILGYTIF